MTYACYVLFGIGVLAYVLAIFNIGSSAGETYSDIGNAVWLLTIILLLLRPGAKPKSPAQG